MSTMTIIFPESRKNQKMTTTTTTRKKCRCSIIHLNDNAHYPHQQSHSHSHSPSERGKSTCTRDDDDDDDDHEGKDSVFAIYSVLLWSTMSSKGAEMAEAAKMNSRKRRMRRRRTGEMFLSSRPAAIVATVVFAILVSSRSVSASSSSPASAVEDNDDTLTIINNDDTLDDHHTTTTDEQYSLHWKIRYRNEEDIPAVSKSRQRSTSTPPSQDEEQDQNDNSKTSERRLQGRGGYDPYDCSKYDGWGDLPDYCQTSAPSSASILRPLPEGDDVGFQSSDAPTASPTPLSSFWQSIIEEMTQNDPAVPVSAPTSSDMAGTLIQSPSPSQPTSSPVAIDTIEPDNGDLQLLPPSSWESVTVVVDDDDDRHVDDAFVDDDDDTVQSQSSDDGADGYDEYNKRPLLPPGIDNAIRLNVTMGIVHMSDMDVKDSHMIVKMCLRTMTMILNDYTTVTGNSPFIVIDGGLDDVQGKVLDVDSEDDEDGNTRRRKTYDDENDSGEYGHNHDHLHGHGRRQLANTSKIPDERGVKAILHLYRVDVRESENFNEWYVLYATYAVVWPGSRKPMTSTDFLAAIEHFGGHVLDVSMSNNPSTASSSSTTVDSRIGDNNTVVRSNLFWDTLKTLDFGQDLLLPLPPWSEVHVGLGDCVQVGMEYDLNDWVVYDESAFGRFGDGNIIYDEPLMGTWTIREWVGLGLFSWTLLIAVAASLAALLLQRQRERDEAWGAVLTEEGVGEILHVGWKYQQGMISPSSKGDDDVDAQQDQLFLQIFDKAKLGYNDENSMLQGGVEQQQHWGPSDGPKPPTTNTTETGTTATPPRSKLDTKAKTQQEDQGPGKK